MGSPCIPGGASGALRACGTTIPTALDTDGPWVGKDWTEWKLPAHPRPPHSHGCRAGAGVLQMGSQVMWPGLPACPPGPDWVPRPDLARPGAQSSASSLVAEVVRIVASGKWLNLSVL